MQDSSQERRILQLLKHDRPGQWVPCYLLNAPPDGEGIILQYCRAISNLRKAKFNGKRENIQNFTERVNGATHGFYCWFPGEYQKRRFVRAGSAIRVARFERQFKPSTSRVVSSTTDLPLFAGVPR